MSPTPTETQDAEARPDDGDPQYDGRALRKQAQQELREQRAWLPSIGEWDVRVERLFLVAGVIIAAIALAGTMLGFGARPPTAALVAFPAIAVGSGWALARWFTPGSYPVTHVAHWLLSGFLWFLICRLLRGLAPVVLPDAFALGQIERIFIAPALFAVVMVVGKRMRLNGFITFIAALCIAFGSLASDEGIYDGDRLVSAASSLQLGRAQYGGGAILMRSTHIGDIREGATPKTTGLATVAAAVTCSTTAGHDNRRTLLGFPGRTISFLGKVCWDRAGKPVQAEFDERHSERHGAGTLRSVRLVNLGTVGAAVRALDTGLVPALDVRYDDRTKTRLARRLVRTASGTDVFDRFGRLNDGLDGQQSGPNQPDLSNQINDTVITQVSADGHRVSMIYALENVDPMASGTSMRDDTGGDNVATADRGFSTHARAGFAIDVLAVTFVYSPAAGSRPATARSYANMLRSTSRGLRRGPHFP